MSSDQSATSPGTASDEHPALVIGSGAGFAGDRHDAALAVIEGLIKYDCPRFLIYEVLAERTLAIAHRLKQRDPAAGYSPWLHKYFELALARCLDNDITIVSNIGSANPAAAAREIQTLARRQGCRIPRVAYVEGDDLLLSHAASELQQLTCIEGTSIDGRELLAANAYLGASALLEALQCNVDVVVVGRTTDTALVLAPVQHVLGLASDACDMLAAGVMGGHLIECGAQVTGGYFADPPRKTVPDFANIGFPILEFFADGQLVITKPAGTGGVVSRATVIEQLLYEIHDPSTYLTPDVILDLSSVEVESCGRDRIRVKGAKGRAPTETLKVTLSLDGGWLGEGEISYAGANALNRAELAADAIRKRISHFGINEALRVDIIGTLSVFDNSTSDQRLNQQPDQQPGAGAAGSQSLRSDGEYRVRAALRSASRKTAQLLADEVLALYCCGPAGGGGVRQSVTACISTASALIARQAVESRVQTTVLE